MHDSDVARFERALSSVTVPPVPVAAIRRDAKDRATRRTRRNAVLSVAVCAMLLCGVIPFKGAPAAAAVLAYVQEMLRPADASRMIVLGAASARVPAADYHRVATLGDAQKVLPFHVLVPPVAAHWKLETVMVATGSDPAIVLLYGSSRGLWVRITERSAAAHATAEDGDVSALIAAPGAPPKTISGIALSQSPASSVMRRTQVTGNVRAVVAATGPHANAAVSTPLR